MIFFKFHKFYEIDNRECEANELFIHPFQCNDIFINWEKLM